MSIKKAKKAIIGLVIVSCALTSVNSAFAQCVYGDVNGDSIVDSADYTLLRKYLIGNISSLPSQDWRIAGDLNLDGSIDSADYTILRSYLLGNLPSLPKVSYSGPEEDIRRHNLSSSDPQYINDEQYAEAVKLGQMWQRIGEESALTDEQKAAFRQKIADTATRFRLNGYSWDASYSEPLNGTSGDSFTTVSVGYGVYVFGGSLSITVDNYNRTYVTTSGAIGPKELPSGTASVTKGTIKTFSGKAPTKDDVFNFLTGWGLSLGAGSGAGIQYSLSIPPFNGMIATSKGVFTPQAGISIGYTTYQAKDIPVYTYPLYPAYRVWYNADKNQYIDIMPLM